MSQKLQFLFLCPSSSFGGLEMQMVNRSREAIDAGHEAVLVTFPGSKMVDYAEKQSVPVEYINIKLNYVDVQASKQLGKIMQMSDTDVCVVGISRHLSLALLARRLKRNKTAIVFYQQLLSGVKKRDPFHNLIYRNIDCAIVPAMYMKKLLIGNTCLNKSKIEVIPYGIDIYPPVTENSEKIALKKKFDLPPNDLIIGMTARFDPSKDQETLIRAFKEASMPEAKLLLVGEGDLDYRNKMIGLVNQLGINDSVIFMPFSFDFNGILNCIDIFVLPTLSETFSLALIQAMAVGLAVVVTDEAGSREAITDFQNGLRFARKDYFTLSNHLKLLSENNELRKKLSSQARLDAQKRYDKKIQNRLFFETCEKVYFERIEKFGLAPDFSLEIGKLI